MQQAPQIDNDYIDADYSDDTQSETSGIQMSPRKIKKLMAQMGMMQKQRLTKKSVSVDDRKKKRKNAKLARRNNR